jgi:flagellar hook-associated protein 3 FlgL
MKISTTQYFNQSTQQLADIQASLNQTQTQLSTGKKITKPSDEPDKAAVITRLDSAIARQQNYQEAIKTANTRYSAEETALTGVSDVLVRIKELTTQAASDSLGDQDRQSLALEIGNLRDQLLSEANAQDANGNYLFAGSRVDQPPFAKNSTGQVSYLGDQARMQIQVGDNRRLNLNRPGSDVFVRVSRTGSNGTTSAVDFFQALDDLTKAVKGSDRIAIQRGISEVDALQNGVSQGLGQVGADQSTVDAQNNVLDQMLLQLKTSKSGVEDLDYTEAVARMNRDELALQAAQGSFAKISQLSLFKYLG